MIFFPQSSLASKGNLEDVSDEEMPDIGTTQESDLDELVVMDPKTNDKVIGEIDLTKDDDISSLDKLADTLPEKDIDKKKEEDVTGVLVDGELEVTVSC